MVFWWNSRQWAWFADNFVWIHSRCVHCTHTVFVMFLVMLMISTYSKKECSVCPQLVICIKHTPSMSVNAFCSLSCLLMLSLSCITHAWASAATNFVISFLFIVIWKSNTMLSYSIYDNIHLQFKSWGAGGSLLNSLRQDIWSIQ